MSVKLLTEHLLEFVTLKRGCTGSSESTLVKMPHCVAAQFMIYWLRADAYSTPNEYLLYFALASVSPPCVSPSHGGFMEASTMNSR